MPLLVSQDQSYYTRLMPNKEGKKKRKKEGRKEEDISESQ